MKIESKGVQNALKMLPHRQQKYLMKAIRLSVDQGVALARTMASYDTGELVSMERLNLEAMIWWGLSRLPRKMLKAKSKQELWNLGGEMRG